ncbi:MAG: hypothetical protein ABIW76_14775 [Fibrobacteria bacterium]
MITNAANARKTDLESPKASLNSSKDALCKGAPQATAPAPAQPGPVAASAPCVPDWTYDSRRSLTAKTTEDLYLKYTTRDGDVLEIHSETNEEIRYDEYAHAGARGKEPALGDAEKLDDAGAAEETDPKQKQLAELREWAKQVEREVRAQQHKILEQMLKQSGRQMDMGDGRFLAFFPETGADGTGKSGEAGATEENGDELVPPYWNAENTSDRIVHFATQMAEISGMDPEEFAETIKDAVSRGFGEAAAATGPLTGSAAKLNQRTHELVLEKLSKWLEERKDLAYNQATRSPAISTADVPDGTENNLQ